MKKLALILAFLVIPCAAFGLEMLNDSSMDAITGQSGVHIAVDDIQMFINIEKLAYIDCDGYAWSTACSGRAGAIYLNQFQIDTLMINAILDEEGGTDGATQSVDYGTGTATQTLGAAGVALFSAQCGTIPLQYDYGTGRLITSCYLNAATGFLGAGLDNMYLDNFTASAITIDVTEKLPMLTQALQNKGGTYVSMNMGGVLIGLPTVELSIGTMTLTPTFTAAVNGNTSLAANEGKDFGTIYIQGLTVAILSGWMEIAPH